MGHLWRTKTRDREETDTGKSAPGIAAIGDIAVIIEGKRLDFELVLLACQMAKRAKRKVHLVHIIEVPRSLPLKTDTLQTDMPQESAFADKLLTQARAMAEEIGCDAATEVVQARDLGTAIVEEAKDHGCSLIMLGLVRDANKAHNNLGKTIPYVLANAPCRVWIVQDPKTSNQG